MATWYLIIILAGSSNVSQQHVEFTGIEACLNAKAILEQKTKKLYQDSVIVCVQDR